MEVGLNLIVEIVERNLCSYDAADPDGVTVAGGSGAARPGNARRRVPERGRGALSWARRSHPAGSCARRPAKKRGIWVPIDN